WPGPPALRSVRMRPCPSHNSTVSSARRATPPKAHAVKLRSGPDDLVAHEEHQVALKDRHRQVAFGVRLGDLPWDEPGRVEVEEQLIGAHLDAHLANELLVRTIERVRQTH